jgi:hypothetical protein
MQVTIIPADNMVMVDGEAVRVDCPAGDGVHAIQWRGAAGHVEYTDNRPNAPLTAEDYPQVVAPHVAAWQAERDRLAAESAVQPATRAELLAQINAEKNRRRDSGFVVDGVLWDSDYAARLAYAEMAARFAAAPDCTVHWKASAGNWVMLDNALFDRVRTAAETHIAAAYEWQRQQEESLSSVPDDQLDGFAVT